METQTIDYDSLAQQAGAITATTQTAPSTSSDVDYDQIAKQVGAISSQPAGTSGVDYDQLAQQSGATHSSNPNPPAVSDPDEGAIHKIWNWSTSPLLDLTRENAGPIERGAEEFASGMTSPVSAALMLLTGGLGSLAEGAGASALESFAPEIAGSVSKAAGVISKMTNAGFTIQQIISTARAVPEVSDAIKDGDTDRALELGTQAILSGAAAAYGAKHLANSRGANEFSFNGDKESIGAFQQSAERGNLEAKNFENANQELIKNKTLDQAALLYHEAAGDPTVLEKWRQEINDNEGVSDKLKGKYDVLLKQAQNLPAETKTLSDKLREDYANDYQRGQQLGMFDAAGTGAENYAGQHTYKLDDEESTLKPGIGIGTKSPEFTKARSFDTLVDALKEGFEPTETGLAVARGRYIRQFSQAEGLRNAEKVLQQTRANDTAPIAVDPSKVRIVDGKRVIAMPAGVDLAKLGDRVVFANVKASRVSLVDAPAAAPEPGLAPTNDLQGELSKTREQSRADRRSAMLRGAADEAQKVFDEPAKTPEPWDHTQTPSAPIHPDEIAEMSRQLGRPVTAEEIPALRRQQNAQQNIDQGLSGNRRDTAGEIREAHRALLDEQEKQNRVQKAYLDVSDYKSGPDKFNSYRIRGGDPVFDEEGNRTAIFDRANLLIHPDFIKPVMQAFQDQSWFRQNSWTKAALKFSTEAKKSLLAFSPFHWTTEALRGLQMGLNPADAIKPPDVDPNGLAMTQGTKHGLTLLGDSIGRSKFDEGVSSSAYIDRVPIVGKLFARATDHLFGDYIPRLKAAAFEKVVDQLRKRLPDAGDQEIYARASEISNAAFGGLNWKQLGVDMSSVDGLRLVMLAPDFEGSTLLFAHAGLKPGGSVVWQSMATIALYNMMVAQTINLLHNGKTDMSHPFSAQSSDGKSSYSIRSMPADLVHAMTDPRSFAYNRLNPLLIRPAIEALYHKDQTGRNVSYERQLGDLLKNVLPITAQGFLFKRPDQTAASQALKGFGVGTTPNHSVAENLAIEKASARGPQGAVEQSQLDAHHFTRGLIDKLRSGEIKNDSVVQAIRDGQISRDTGQRILKESKMPPLVANVASLPLNDALDIYAAATQQEKQMLLPELRKKIISFRQNAPRTKTAQQRQFFEARIAKILPPANLAAQ
jgi:hypothetical protein